jgi:hypothetical protein
MSRDAEGNLTGHGGGSRLSKQVGAFLVCLLAEELSG